MSISQCQQRSHFSSRRDNRKLASYEVAGMCGKIKIRPEGTVEHQPPIPTSFQDGRISRIHYQPLRSWLISRVVRDEIRARKGRRKPSPQIFFIVINLVFLEKRHIFLLKSFCPMMLGLVGNVFLDCVAIGNAHGKRAITRLPRKIFYADGFVNPPRRCLFDVLHKRRERMGRAQTHQQMNVIRRAAAGFGNAVRRANQTAEVFVQTRKPFVRDERMPVFRAEHDVKMQA